ncbi:MAG: CotH kinase family protein [Proteobacteria bacterium]|nr:CotH kinase family protein [Pseudomonadota bacterium]
MQVKCFFSWAPMALALTLCACGGGKSASPAPATPSSTGTTDPTNPTNPTNPTGPDGQVAEPDADFEELFALDTVHTIRIVISEDEWQALLNDFDNNSRTEVYRRADFFYGIGADAERVSNVGFRVRGNSFSRQRPQRGNGELIRAHFKVKFNERFDEDESAYGPPSVNIPEISDNRGRLFRGVRSLNFKHNRIDRTYLREVFVQDAFNRFDVRAARWAFARMYIQIGEREQYFGVYHMAQALDSSWVRMNFDRSAFLFKCLWQGFGPANLAKRDFEIGATAGAIGQEITDPAFLGQAWEAYRPAYDLKTRDSDFLEAERALNDLIELLAGQPTRAQLEQAINIPALLKSQAVSSFVGQWDGYWRNGNNYYLLIEPGTNRWLFVPFDYDLVLTENFSDRAGSRDMSGEPFLDWGRKTFADNLNPVLMQKVLAIEEFQTMYLDYVRQLVDEQSGPFDPNNARRRLSQMSALIAPHTTNYDADPQTSFTTNIDEITNFINSRALVARAESGAGGRRR